MNTEKFFPDITLPHFLILEFTMLLPCGLAAGLLWYYGLPMITLIIYILICCLIVPGIYIKFVSGLLSLQVTHISATFSGLYLSRHEQFKWGMLGFLISGALMGGILYVTLTYLHFWQIENVHLLYYPKTEVIVVSISHSFSKQLSIILVLIHPFAEEFYWREFVQAALTHSMSYEPCPEPANWWVAIHYALYYIFIFANFVQQFWMALLCAAPFILVARKFTLMRHKGLLTAILAHTGLNIGFVVILNVWFWNQWQIN